MIKNVGYTVCYKADMRCLFQLLLNREKNVVEVHKLLGAMFNCIYFQRAILQVKDPERVEGYQRELEASKVHLRELMNAWCLLEGDKQLIWSLVGRTV